MKKITIWIDETTITEMEKVLEKYEQKATFMRNAIQTEIDKRKEIEANKK
jgi:hypothetical protein